MKFNLFVILSFLVLVNIRNFHIGNDSIGSSHNINYNIDKNLSQIKLSSFSFLQSNEMRKNEAQANTNVKNEAQANTNVKNEDKNSRYKSIEFFE